jgi:hypothetical protein
MDFISRLNSLSSGDWTKHCQMGQFAFAAGPTTSARWTKKARRRNEWPLAEVGKADDDDGGDARRLGNFCLCASVCS